MGYLVGGRVVDHGLAAHPVLLAALEKALFVLLALLQGGQVGDLFGA